MPLKTFLIGPEAADEIRYRVDSFARRVATSLSSLEAYYEKSLSENISSKRQELRDRCEEVQKTTNLQLQISHAARDELPVNFTSQEIEKESKSRALTVALTWIGEEATSLPPQRLTTIVDLLQKGVHDVSHQSVVLKREMKRGDMETIQILSKHMGIDIPLFLWPPDGNLHLFNNSKFMQLGEDYLPTLFATAFTQTCFNEVVGSLSDKDEIENLEELFRSEILNTECDE